VVAVEFVIFFMLSRFSVSVLIGGRCHSCFAGYYAKTIQNQEKKNIIAPENKKKKYRYRKKQK